MQTLQAAIDQAASTAGSNRALAEMLGVSPQRLNEWKHGHRPCPLHNQARIAELAGVDPKEWVWREICRQLGRATAAVLLTLAASLAAFGAPGVGGVQSLARRLKCATMYRLSNTP